MKNIIRIKEKKQIAFTLAEILITLSIIGVIASMTVPSLVQDVQDAQFKTAWKKTFADIDQANRRILLENGGSIKKLFTSNEHLRDSYLKYLNYTKKCDSFQSLGNCWHSYGSFKLLNGTAITSGGWETVGGAILNNGTLLWLWNENPNCQDSQECAVIRADLNGFRGPNTIGKDIHTIRVEQRKIAPWGNSTSCSNDGFDCTAYFLTH